MDASLATPATELAKTIPAACAGALAARANGDEAGLGGNAELSSKADKARASNTAIQEMRVGA